MSGDLLARGSEAGLRLGNSVFVCSHLLIECRQCGIDAGMGV